MKRLVSGLLVLAALIVGPSLAPRTAHASGSRSVGCSGASPQVTVRQYYQAVARHQADLALSCFSPLTRGLMQQNSYPDWRNVASIRSLHLHSHNASARDFPGDAATTARPYAVVQVVADYVVRYYHQAMNLRNGKASRAIYVVKQLRSSPWRIAAIELRAHTPLRKASVRFIQ